MDSTEHHLYNFPRNPSPEPEAQPSSDSQCPCAVIHLSTAGPPEKVESEAASDELPDCQPPWTTNVQTENGSKSLTDDDPKSFIRYWCYRQDTWGKALLLEGRI